MVLSKETEDSSQLSLLTRWVLSYLHI